MGAGSATAAASVNAISANSAPLVSIAALAPPATTRAPPTAGPAMKQIENAELAIALPSRRSPAGDVTVTVVARASDLAASAMTPSIAVSTSNGARLKLLAIQASNRNAMQSSAYSAGRIRRAGLRSSRATSSGDSRPGTNCEQRKKAVAPKALWVRW